MIYSIVYKVKYAFSKHKKRINYRILSAVFLALFLLSLSILPTENIIKTVYDSELKFSETSLDSNIEGSVLPASCESYPTLTLHHTYGGDAQGHCGGTCPAPSSVVSLPWWRACTYEVLPVPWWDGSPTYYSNILSASQSCPATDGINILYSQNTINANICRTTCWDSSFAVPHLGQTCPAQPAPTVNIWFDE